MRVEPGTAARVLTGGMLPPGADAVVPVEDTDAATGCRGACRDASVSGSRSRPGTSVRPAGTDLRAGDAVWRRAASRPRVAALAAAGNGHARGPSSAARRGSCHRRRARSRRSAARPHRSPTATRRRGRAGADAGRRSSSWASRRDDAAVMGAASAWEPRPRTRRRERGRLGRCPRRGQTPSRGPARWSSGASPFSRASRSPSAVAKRADGRSSGCSACPGNPVSSLVTFELFVRPMLRRWPATATQRPRDRPRSSRGQCADARDDGHSSA